MHVVEITRGGRRGRFKSRTERERERERESEGGVGRSTDRGETGERQPGARRPRELTGVGRLSSSPPGLRWSLAPLGHPWKHPNAPRRSGREVTAVRAPRHEFNSRLNPRVLICDGWVRVVHVCVSRKPRTLNDRVLKSQ